jgi:hypothetical protein
MTFGRWVLGAADATVRVSDGILHAESLSRRALSGGRNVLVGAAQVHRIGVSGRFAAESVVASAGPDAGLHHGDDDKERALAALDAWFGQFRADVEPRASAIDAHPATAQWWRADIMPVLSDWALFRAHQSSWVNRLATEWTTYVAWLTQVRLMRAGARMSGMVLTSPEPTKLPETIFERGASGRGSKLETAWTLGRVLLYTAIGVAGVASLWAVYRELGGRREGTEAAGDPEEE